MQTEIIVVDGADGLTPDMMRVRKPAPVPEAKEYEHDRRIRAQFNEKQGG